MSNNRIILLVLNLIIIILIGVSAIKGLAIKDGIKVNSVKETLNLGKAYEEVEKNYANTKNQYEGKLKTQETVKQTYEKTKQEFEQIKNINSYEALVEMAAKREFNIEALWIKLGLLAENNELSHAFYIVSSQDNSALQENQTEDDDMQQIPPSKNNDKLPQKAPSQNTDITDNNQTISEDTSHDINVEVTGTYSAIRNFINDIMLDMDIMFKAENVKIVPEGEENLKATFTIRNVNIIM